MKENKKKEFFISRRLHFAVRFTAAMLVLLLVCFTGHAAITFCLGLFADGNYVVQLPGQDSPLVQVSEVSKNDEKVYIDPSQVVEIARAEITVVGDLMLHMPIVRSSQSGSGYNFDSIFTYVKSYISGADYAVANLETTLSGTDGKDYAGFPDFNSPDAIAASAKNAGFDMLLTGNNQCYNYGFEGLQRTLSVLREQNLAFIGTRDTKEEPRHVVKSIGGVKVGMTSYTFADLSSDGKATLNGHTAGSEDSALINIFDYDDLSTFYTEIENEIATMRAKDADAIVVYLHWGNDYSTSVSDTQRTIAQRLCDLGVDVIAGSHPHMVQSMDLLSSSLDPSRKTLCLYSLGNFLSNLRSDNIGLTSSHCEDGLMFNFTLSKYNDGTVRISAVNLYPTWVLVRGEGDNRDFCILPLDQNNGNWQGTFNLTDTQLDHAKMSHTRTMELITPGMNKVIAYLADKNAALDPSLGVG